MSLSLLDRLTLRIHPRRVMLTRQPWRGPAQSWTTEVDSAGADGQGVIAAVESVLKAHAARWASVQVVVADSFVRYALLPWSESVVSEKDRLAVARALFANVLGAKVAGLEIALDRAQFGQNGIAAGIDGALLAALRSLIKAQGLRLQGVQPRLVAEWNAHRKQLEDGWFVLLDTGWLSLIGARDGQVRCVRNHRLATDNAAELASELAGLLTAESATVDRKKVQILQTDVGLSGLGAPWESTVVPATLAGGTHA